MAAFKRQDKRTENQLRKITVTYDCFGYAAANVLFQIGQTKVLCSVTIQHSVPQFLKGKKTGWLAAEYAMLPTATKQRAQRSCTVLKQQGRSVEIARLISRTLRSVVDLDSLGERTIMVDCDVLQADGGTRAAAITGACLALQKAQALWLKKGLIEKQFLNETVAAISAGVIDDHILLDLNFAEDSIVDTDFNFVLTQSGKIVEIQGTAERTPLTWDHFEQLKSVAIKGIKDLFDCIKDPEVGSQKQHNKVPLFSLQNRLNNTSSL